jgi:hypothetical protein
LRIFYAAKVGQYPPMEQNEAELERIKLKLNNDVSKPTTQQESENVFETHVQFKQIKDNKRFGANNAYFQRYQQQ